MPVVKAAESLREEGLVTRCLAGEISPVGGGPTRLSLQPIRGGIKATVFGNNQRQDVVMFTTGPDQAATVQETLEQKLAKRYQIR